MSIKKREMRSAASFDQNTYKTTGGLSYRISFFVLIPTHKCDQITRPLQKLDNGSQISQTVRRKQKISQSLALPADVIETKSSRTIPLASSRFPNHTASCSSPSSLIIVSVGGVFLPLSLNFQRSKNQKNDEPLSHQSNSRSIHQQSLYIHIQWRIQTRCYQIVWGTITKSCQEFWGAFIIGQSLN